MSGFSSGRLLAAIGLLVACMAAHARTVEGVVSHVTDGDSVWVKPISGATPIEVRLQGIDAPEICQAFGILARDALAARVLRRRVVVKSRAHDKYSRTLGQLIVGGEDVGAWMVSRGYAWSYRFGRRGGPYLSHEAQARSARLGLWAHGAPMRPGDFRKRHGSCK